MSSANRKLVVVRAAMLTVPSCYSSTSDIILSRKIVIVIVIFILQQREIYTNIISK